LEGELGGGGAVVERRRPHPRMHWRGAPVAASTTLSLPIQSIVDAVKVLCGSSRLPTSKSILANKSDLD
jgi:hypothetical protein